eukprot:Protomagalhaensia_wolfi_Nauph_80__4696@NODE_486_length_2443_cov_408_004576_g366_i0_p2_GENE_NODE_486_length_2443_cov_408_004576_g366_i0NODE_486_length_2443_cov_408_004576_g366_i0_p2_ORF_typecomplete_len190_score25_22Sensor/PF13796_6/0_18Sensor/PF13796_6/5_4e02TM_helix/PF05552_12/4_1e03TM_helix/PF05552_12/0_18Bac_export_2/PF01312_19/0_26Bac_export_2/PF01312_19/4_7e03_NODE_486_length_2443_cov_408_004576_g366_i018152384
MKQGTRRGGSGIVYDSAPADWQQSSSKLLRMIGGIIKTALVLALISLVLDIQFPPIVVQPLQILNQVFDASLQATLLYWPSILSATFVFLGALFIIAYIKNRLLQHRLRWSKVDRWDTSGPTQYPDGYVFVAQKLNSAELERVKDETTQRELRLLFRTPEWRAHLRERGRDEANYNWQKRKSEVDLLWS